MSTDNCLFELGCEELPPKSLKKLAQALLVSVQEQLLKAELPYGDMAWYASPRRIALFIRDLGAVQPDQHIERRGPAVKAAFDDKGLPSKALQGFARSNGADVSELSKLETDKGAWMVYEKTEPGKTIQSLLPDILSKALKQLPIPKPMRWGSGDIEFIRPVHWAVLLYGADVIKTEILGVQTSHITRGHRFHHPAEIALANPEEYLSVLSNPGHLIADFAERQATITQQITQLAETLGGKPVMDAALLEEVTAIVEWPEALIGEFDAAFLAVPSEALITAMQQHQKVFPVEAEGKLLPYFIAISNIRSSNPEIVKRGNEKVISARLSDAQFFYQTDLKMPLSDRVDALKSILFQHQLGSLYDKAHRLSSLSGKIAVMLNADKAQAERAGLLAKADLVSDMVGEFPELQGIMGQYYAQATGESAEVATAIREHYHPRFSGDLPPKSKSGLAVALADKLDSLVGIIGIGQPPSGDKDPFALRRAAIGVLQCILTEALPLDLVKLIEAAISNYQLPLADDTASTVLDFFFARQKALYSEQKISAEVINAVVALRPSQPIDYDARIKAVNHFGILPEAKALAAANKRVSNILKKSADFSVSAINTGLFEHPEEQTLYAAITEHEQQLKPLLKARDYQAALSLLAGLREPVDAFFEAVLVNSENKAQRQNRLSLLANLRNLFLTIADISLLPD